MESETNNQESNKIDEVEGFGSEGDLLDEKSDISYKRQSSHKSCDDVYSNIRIACEWASHIIV